MIEVAQPAETSALKRKQSEACTTFAGTKRAAGFAGVSSQTPALSPCAHQIELRWKSSSGAEPTGEVSAQPEHMTKNAMGSAHHTLAVNRCDMPPQVPCFVLE
ncbi:unannotated protein [freshwater metagenome]|uniref:Unannotated protein n=1 Tax=freshwater metagenome TaxID=449393 RepID=A0A6J7QVA6_9ZZZZ